MDQLTQNKDVVRRWFSALSGASYDEAWALMDQAGDYWVLRGRRTMKIADFAGVYQGHVDKTFVDGLRFEPNLMTAEDDRVSARVDGTATLRNGESFDNSYHFLFAVNGGLITAVWEYGDTYMSWKAFGGVDAG